MKTLVKNPNANINGTSWHNNYIIATKKELVELFGEPCYEETDIDEKVQNEWDFDFTDDECDINCVVTLYDWKEYRKYSDNEKIEWHIGGHNSIDTQRVQEYLRSLL